MRGWGGGGRDPPFAASRDILELRRAAAAAPGAPRTSAAAPALADNQLAAFKGFLQRAYNLLKNRPTDKKAQTALLLDLACRCWSQTEVGCNCVSEGTGLGQAPGAALEGSDR